MGNHFLMLNSLPSAVGREVTFDSFVANVLWIQPLAFTAVTVRFPALGINEYETSVPFQVLGLTTLFQCCVPTIIVR